MTMTSPKGILLIFAVALVIPSPTGLFLSSGANDRTEPPTAVWIDTDPSVTTGGHEVDDGLALIQAFHSWELLVRGISIVFGNAALKDAVPIADEIIKRFGPKHLSTYAGAASADQLGEETPASQALASALQKEPLTILALGPVTNIATVLRQHPELHSRFIRIVAVAGRRPNQRFTTGASGNKPFKDFNFELDPRAFQVLLDSEIPLILAPWELSSQVWITAWDLEYLRAHSTDLAWLYRAAVDWLNLWQERFRVSGFNPFDTLAVGIVTSRRFMTCERFSVEIRILPSDTPAEAVSADMTKPYLLVSRNFEGQRFVEYCFHVQSEFKDDLLSRLVGSR